MDGPLEPPSSATASVTDSPDDPSFVNFFSVCISLFSISHFVNSLVAGQSLDC